MNIGWQEILIILLIILILFGAKKIPELARSIGKGIQEFKKGLSGEIDEEEEPKEEKTKKKQRKKKRTIKKRTKRTKSR